MARFSALVVLLVATMAVAAVAAEKSQRRRAFYVDGTNPFLGAKFNWGTTSYSWTSWKYCKWNPTDETCTFLNWGMWFPKVAPAQVWVGPVQPPTTATDLTTIYASCINPRQSFRGVVSAGACGCNDGTDDVAPLASGPIGFFNGIVDCGSLSTTTNGGPTQCTAWNCICPTGFTATAWANCV